MLDAVATSCAPPLFYKGVIRMSIIETRDPRSLAQLIMDNETVETLRGKQHDVLRSGAHSSRAAERALAIARVYQQEINTLIENST